jgi:hypothetical protein
LPEIYRTLDFEMPPDVEAGSTSQEEAHLSRHTQDSTEQPVPALENVRGFRVLLSPLMVATSMNQRLHRQHC